MDMAGLTGRAGRRLLRSLATWPDLAGWAFSAGIAALSLAGMGAIGFSTGYYALHPPLLKGLPLRLITVLIAPGLGEEIPFRGLLVPGRSEAAKPWPSLILVTAVFTAWHIVEVFTILPAARTAFLRPDFLACAATLGLGCGLVRWRTGSLWPAVLLHWLAVTIWQRLQPLTARPAWGLLRGRNSRGGFSPQRPLSLPPVPWNRRVAGAALGDTPSHEAAAADPRPRGRSPDIAGAIGATGPTRRRAAPSPAGPVREPLR